MSPDVANSQVICRDGGGFSLELARMYGCWILSSSQRFGGVTVGTGLTRCW